MHHLWQILKHKTTSLWASWILKSVLKGKPFWAIPVPTDCSWIWRKILSLRDEARPFVQYTIGNGEHTSLWFDPWYQHDCLASYPTSAMISHSGISETAKVSAIILNNQWSLPCLVHNNRNIDSSLVNWIYNFNHRTPMDTSKHDSISWNGVLEGKVSARTIWLDLRKSANPVAWCPIVWNRMKIARYAFIQWMPMHGRLPTMERLAKFGLYTNQRCFLCIDAAESQEHLFISCNYSRYVLVRVFNLITIAAVPTTWNSMINFLLSLTKPYKDLAFLAFQIFMYHIWRERNCRAHDKGLFNPDTLLKGIILELRSRASSSIWFIKQTIKYPLLQH